MQQQSGCHSRCTRGKNGLCSSLDGARSRSKAYSAASALSAVLRPRRCTRSQRALPEADGRADDVSKK